jgi:uncharacterized protein DUF4124
MRVSRAGLRAMNRRLLLIFSVLPAFAAADIYRYVDKDGVVTYTEQLPFGVTGERIVTESAGPTQTVRNLDGSTAASDVTPPASGVGAPVANDKVKLTKQQQSMLQELKAADDARKQELAKIRDANCARSKDVLERLQARGRIRVKDDDGQERMIGEDEREQRIQEAQDGITTNCSGS